MPDATESNPPRSLLSQAPPPRCWLVIAFHNGEEKIVGAGFDKWEAMINAATQGFFRVVVRRLPDGSELVQ